MSLFELTIQCKIFVRALDQKHAEGIVDIIMEDPHIRDCKILNVEELETEFGTGSINDQYEFSKVKKT